MSNNSDNKRLAEAVESLAATITEVIELKIKQMAKPPGEPICGPITNLDLPVPQGWVGKKEVAAHLKVSLRTVHHWMARRWIPYIRLGRSVRFKLSDIDESVSRWLKVEGRY